MKEQSEFSDELLCLEEALEVAHLPDAHENEDDGLPKGPPQHTGVGAVAHRTETLLTQLKKQS